MERNDLAPRLQPDDAVTTMRLARLQDARDQLRSLHVSPAPPWLAPGFQRNPSPPLLMTHRKFTDAEGVHWEVYDVVALPGFGRPGEPQLAPHSEVFRAARTWLMFESPKGKRRLPSIPNDWERAPDDELQRWLAMATAVPKDAH